MYYPRIKVTVTDDTQLRRLTRSKRFQMRGSLASNVERKKAEPDNGCDIVKVEDKTETTDLKAGAVSKRLRRLREQAEANQL